MASTLSFVEYVCEQAKLAGEVTFKKMFGEYAIYLDDKLVALVCDDHLMLKPTDAGRSLLQKPEERPPYPGAKPHLLIDACVDDKETLASLFSATAKALPQPKPKQKR